MSLLRIALAFAFLVPIAHAQQTSPTPVPYNNAAKLGILQDPGKRMHWGADESQMNRKTNTIFLKGNAYLMRDNEEIYADEIEFNQKTQLVKARGRVRYQYGENFVKADSVDLDLINKTGVIINGNLTNGKFALRGSRMEQIGEDRFLIKDYDYTTCLDCPNSWEITGREVDLTIEGYAFIKDFIFKVKDASLVWMPYMVMPVKTKRQTGFLFPRAGGQQVYGIYYLQPFYFAPNDWWDMTVTGGYLSKRGTRAEWEGRYAISGRSGGSFNFYYVHDESVPRVNIRYAAKAAITQELPFGIEGKFRFNEVSDSGYPIEYFDDIEGRYQPTLNSDLFFSRNTPSLSAVVSARRIRNLLYYDKIPVPQADGTTSFIFPFDAGNDRRTVQEFPRIVVNSNDQFIFGSKIAAGIEARFNRFARGAEAFDYFQGESALECPPAQIGTPACQRTIREAQRFTFIPNLYTTFHPSSWLSVTPNLQYRSYLYNFNNTLPNLARGYLLTQTELSMQLEKYISTSDPNISYKHTIRPTLTYSLIPTTQESDKNHEFLQQVSGQAKPGRYFDNSDIVPIHASQNLDTYFIPLGNSLTYGVLSQLFRKTRSANGTSGVERKLEVSVTQTLDIEEVKRSLDAGHDDNRVLLSPLFTHFQYDDPKFSTWVDYIYYSYLDRYSNPNPDFVRSPHRFGLGVTWNFEKNVHQGVLQFERSFTMAYSFSKLTSKLSNLRTYLNFSLNDYIMPRLMLNFDLVSNAITRLPSARYTVLFQSPSRCWRLETGVAQSYDLGTGFSFIFDFALNLTGEPFGAVGQPM